MTLYYHPENQPLKFWGIKRIGSGENGLVKSEIKEKREYGFYKRVMEAEGNKVGGAVIIEAGWYKPSKNEWLDPETGRSAKPTTVRCQLSLERPIAHFGSEWPTISISVLGLIIDLLKSK